MKYNFSTIELVGIDGKKLDAKAHQSLGNAIYTFTKDLGLVDKAMEIYKGKEVDLGDTEIKIIKSIIEDERVQFHAFVKKAMLDYINSVK